MADAPKPPKKEAKPPTPTPSALKYQHSNMMQSSTAQYAHMLSGKSRATTYPSQSVDGSAGINAYGDSEDSMGFLAGRGAFLLQSGATYVTAGPSNLSAVTSGYRHTANLGPTGLAPASDLYKPLGSHNYWPSEDAEVPAWRRGLEDYSGGERIYTEAETLSFFKDAAAGYDFNDEGEKAIDEALVTIGLEQQGDSFPG